MMPYEAEMGTKILQIPVQNDIGFFVRKKVRRHHLRSCPGDGRGAHCAPPYYCLSDRTPFITVYQTVRSQTNEMISFVKLLNKSW